MRHDGKIDITFLAHNHSELSLKCLQRVVKFTKNLAIRLIYVDNDSDWFQYEPVRKFIANEFENHEIIRLQENKFYAGGVNIGLKYAMRSGRSKYLVTLSNDVYVTKHWLEKLLLIMERNPDIGVLSPLTDNISRCCANADKMIRSMNLLPPESRKKRKLINDLPEKFYFCRANVPLFCGVIRRDVIKKVGYLDERFFILGNDDDYSDRVRLAGFKTCVALNVFVNHIHGATKHELFPQPGRAKIKAKHRELLAQKREWRRRTGSYR